MEWKREKSYTGEDNYILYDGITKFTIAPIGYKTFWLHQNISYVGIFTTLKKAQKVVELIIKG